MSYSVICPSCDTSFLVDPHKVPEEGVLAQCSMCPEVFEVMRPDETEVAPTIETSEGVLETETSAGAGGGVRELGTDSLGGRQITFDQPITSPEPVLEEAAIAEPEVELAPEPEVELAPEPVADEVPAVEEARAEPDTPVAAPIQFGRRDPADKAKSLARSLVSDIVAYHKEKHTQSLEAGTLVEEFDEEIQKSWKEYTDQVDADMLAGSTFFNDALNEILAGGEDMFNLDG
ncbi:MAG: zinc-ribbon domain-containing protein [Gemmatimonadetes bacterium]|nr:zinc-ribbon domain-containing protein [Gemmatimonadota bacterium]